MNSFITISLMQDRIDFEKAHAQELMELLNNLIEAVGNVYYAAHWSPDRKLDVDAEELWENLRDAAGLPPGFSPKKTK